MQTLSAGSMMGLKPTKIPTTTDPDFASVVFLADFEGAHQDTSYTEQSSNATALTFISNAELNNTRPGFGSTALELDGAASWVQLASPEDLSTQPFTIECTVQLDSLAAFPMFTSVFNETSNQRSWYWGYLSGSMYFGFSPDGINTNFVSRTWSAATSTTYQLCVTRDVDTLAFYVDGTRLGTTIDVSSAIYDTYAASTAPLRIGSAQGGSDFDVDGMLDDVRLTFGVARYGTGTSYTLPTGPFPIS